MTSGTRVLSSPDVQSQQTVQNVTFGPLATSHAGVYSCASTLSSPALTTPYQTMQSYTVTVSGMILGVVIGEGGLGMGYIYLKADHLKITEMAFILHTASYLVSIVI